MSDKNFPFQSKIFQRRIDKQYYRRYKVNAILLYIYTYNIFQTYPKLNKYS